MEILAAIFLHLENRNSPPRHSPSFPSPSLFSPLSRSIPKGQMRTLHLERGCRRLIVPLLFLRNNYPARFLPSPLSKCVPHLGKGGAGGHSFLRRSAERLPLEFKVFHKIFFLRVPLESLSARLSRGAIPRDRVESFCLSHRPAARSSPHAPRSIYRSGCGVADCSPPA